MLHLVVRGRDPSAVAVLVEDGAAVAGLLIAASCLGLTSYTGNVVYDAVGSIAIGGTDSIHVPKAWFSYVADDRRAIVSDHSRRKFTKDFMYS